MKYSAEFEILRENFQTLRGFIFEGGFVFNNHENVVGFHALRCTNITMIINYYLTIKD